VVGNGYGEPWSGGIGMQVCHQDAGFGWSAGGKELGGGKPFPPSGGGTAKVPCRFFLEGRCTRGASCGFSHERRGGRAGADADEDLDLLEIEAAMAEAQGGGPAAEAAADAEMMAHLEDLAKEDSGRGSDGDSDAGDRLPPPASQAEIEEAQEIVRRAEKDLVERNKMKAKVKGASRDDLQAMINARIGRK